MVYDPRSLMGKMSELHIEMEEKFKLPDNLFVDNPKFVDTSHEFDDDCGDACKI